MTDAAPYAEIAVVVRTYVEGMCQNDPAKLRTAMHERACSIGHFDGGLEWDGREGLSLGGPVRQSTRSGPLVPD